MQQLVETEISSFAKTMKRSTALSSLPEDIIIVILSMLPVKSILRFRCVCKFWLKSLKNPNFIKMHLNHAVENNDYNVFISHSYKEPPSCYCINFDAASASNSSNKAVKIDLPSTVQSELLSSRTCVGSCDGILCFSRQNILNNSVTLCLWNPSTQEYKEIVKKYGGSVMAYGFSYDCKIHDYKLILISDKNADFSEIQVYTVGSNSWKKIGNTLSVYFGTYCSQVLEGAMHWLTRKVKFTGDQPAGSMVIVSFDIAEETTKEIQIPSCFLELQIKSRLDCNARVGLLGKDLYLSVCVSDIFELWVMKDYGVVESWTKVLRISQKIENIRIWRTLSYFNKNREVLFSCSTVQGRYFKGALVSYDLRHERFRSLNINDMPGSFNEVSAETFTGSLVSFNSTR